MWTVYKHTTPSGKYYIGITSKSPKERWRRNGAGYSTQPFYYAILKYGWENIKHEIIKDGLTEQEAKELEISLICEAKKNGLSYNITDGGDGFLGFSKPAWNKGIPVPQEQRDLLSRLAKERGITPENRNKMIEGRNKVKYHHPEHVRRKISRSKKGVSFTQEHIAHIVESGSTFKKGHIPWNAGRKMSDEQKLKISINNGGSKSIRNLKTGEIYRNGKIASESTGIGYCTLLKRAKLGKDFEFI